MITQCFVLFFSCLWISKLVTRRHKDNTQRKDSRIRFTPQDLIISRREQQTRFGFVHKNKTTPGNIPIICNSRSWFPANCVTYRVIFYGIICLSLSVRISKGSYEMTRHVKIMRGHARHTKDENILYK